MLGALKQILLLLAWGILFAHSVVPHSHEEKAERDVFTINHEHESSFFDALSHIFHFSTGEDHLEDFSKNNGFQLALFAPSFCLPIVQFVEVERIAEVVKQLQSRAPPLINGLRAPPFRL
jgi:hypothetical protein